MAVAAKRQSAVAVPVLEGKIMVALPLLHCVSRPAPVRALRAKTFAALALCLMALGGCKSTGDTTGSINGPAAVVPTTNEALQSFSDDWGKRYEAEPGNRNAALNYARALRAQGRSAQAVAVLQGAVIKHSDDLEMLGAYGKALADAGRLKDAADVLARAHTPERPNWNILSAQGSVADQLGDHAGAQNYYLSALKIAPGEPTVLSNLGLSYALSNQLPLAETTLRQAVASPQADKRVRQNLALVLALQGNFTEAEAISRRDLSPTEAASNVAAIRAMIAQSNTWREIQKPGAGRVGKQAAVVSQ